MNIILCHPYDQDAIWLYTELKRVEEGVVLVAPEQLLMAKEWTQNLTTDFDSFTISTKSGITIDSDEPHFLLNRTQLAAAPIWSRAKDAEKNYALAEMNAMLMGWLKQIHDKNTIFNPPVGYSLSGVFWTDSQWTKAAYEAGFENVAIGHKPRTSEDSILVVGNEVISDKTDVKLIECALSLSKITGTPLLEIVYDKYDQKILGANSFPPLRKYGNRLTTLIKHRLL